MNQFGLAEATVHTAVSSVRPKASDIEQLRDSFARAAWSGIAEPGDSTAGRLVSALGAPAALAALVEDWPHPRLESALRAVGAQEDIDETALRAGRERWRPRLNSESVLGFLRTAARRGARLLVPGDALWPAGLGSLGEHGPLALWLLGQPAAVAALENSLALVGARAATAYGEHVAMEAAAGLADRGVAIVSGAAYGIDGMAHRSTLASGGQTIAFLAGGVDRFYPSGHDALLTKIAAAGAVLSELPCGASPTKWRFLQRNRLIAAASQATVVLEAGWRSGSLNTAGHAATMGRPLGAVPGPVTSAASAGCHRLIREFDAVCVTTSEEMAELLPNQPEPVARGREAAVIDRRSPDQTRIIDSLSARARSAQEIARRSGLALSTVHASLGPLALEGFVVESESGWRRAPGR